MTLRPGTGSLLAGGAMPESSVDVSQESAEALTIRVLGVWHRAVDEAARECLSRSSNARIEIIYIATAPPSTAGRVSGLRHPVQAEWAVGLNLVRNLALQHPEVHVTYRQVEWEDRSARYVVSAGRDLIETMVFLPLLTGTAPAATRISVPVDSAAAVSILADVDGAQADSGPLSVRTVLCSLMSSPSAPPQLDDLVIRSLEPVAGFTSPPSETSGTEPVAIVVMRLMYLGRAGFVVRRRRDDSDTDDLHVHSLPSARVYDSDLAHALDAEVRSDLEPDVALDKILLKFPSDGPRPPRMRLEFMQRAAARELLLRTGLFFDATRLHHIGNHVLPRDFNAPDHRQLFYGVFVVDLVRDGQVDELELLRDWDRGDHQVIFDSDYVDGTHGLALNRLLLHGRRWLINHAMGTSAAE
jgi:hypothetical protein